MGVGNLGKNLSFNYDELNTYLSRDGGRTWFEVKKGAYIFEYGDHGSILILAELNTAT